MNQKRWNTAEAVVAFAVVFLLVKPIMSSLSHPRAIDSDMMFKLSFGALMLIVFFFMRAYDAGSASESVPFRIGRLLQVWRGKIVLVSALFVVIMFLLESR